MIELNKKNNKNHCQIYIDIRINYIKKTFPNNNKNIIDQSKNALQINQIV